MTVTQQTDDCIFFFSGRNWSRTRQTDDCIFFFSCRNENFPSQQKNCQFPVRTKNWYNIQHNSPDRRLYLFFPVVIKISCHYKKQYNSTTRQTDDCIFFSGRNRQNRAPNRQTVNQEPCSRKNQTLTQHNKTTGKKVPPVHVKRVYSFLCEWVCLWGLREYSKRVKTVLN